MFYLLWLNRMTDPSCVVLVHFFVCYCLYFCVILLSVCLCVCLSDCSLCVCIYSIRHVVWYKINEMKMGLLLGQAEFYAANGWVSEQRLTSHSTKQCRVILEISLSSQSIAPVLTIKNKYVKVFLNFILKLSYS